jgi:hypothetical protein
MDPLSKFSHDAAQYIYQTPNVWIIEHGAPPNKPFSINAPEKSKKTKKDLEKRKEKEKDRKE